MTNKKDKRCRGSDCPRCNKKTEYLDRWDSFFCPECNIWTDSACNCKPEECEFVGRPAKPAHDIARLSDELLAAHRALYGNGKKKNEEMDEKKVKKLLLMSGFVTLDALEDRLMKLGCDPTHKSVTEISAYKQEFVNKLRNLLGDNWKEEIDYCHEQEKAGK